MLSRACLLAGILLIGEFRLDWGMITPTPDSLVIERAIVATPGDCTHDAVFVPLKILPPSARTWTEYNASPPPPYYCYRVRSVRGNVSTFSAPTVPTIKDETAPNRPRSL